MVWFSANTPEPFGCSDEGLVARISALGFCWRADVMRWSENTPGQYSSNVTVNTLNCATVAFFLFMAQRRRVSINYRLGSNKEEEKRREYA